MHQRKGRLEDQLLRVVSEILFRRAKDPRLDGVFITRVEMTPDLRRADVYFMMRIAGHEMEEATAQEGLERAKGYIRSRIAKAVQLRRIPEIQFLYDDSQERSAAMEVLLRKARGNG